MNKAWFEQTHNVVIAANELVKGQEQEFIAAIKPLVDRQSICLDLGAVRRIDAAGLAALITLYCDACKAGHRFANPSPRVQEILALVGLEAILVSRNTEKVSFFGTQWEQTAA